MSVKYVSAYYNCGAYKGVTVIDTDYMVQHQLANHEDEYPIELVKDLDKLPGDLSLPFPLPKMTRVTPDITVLRYVKSSGDYLVRIKGRVSRVSVNKLQKLFDQYVDYWRHAKNPERWCYNYWLYGARHGGNYHGEPSYRR